MKPIECVNGYIAVNLTTKGKRIQKHIHIMVLESFVGERPIKHDGCHNDGNKKNCKLENLRWDTRKNNHKDKIKHGTHLLGEKIGTSKISIKQATFIKNSNLTGVELSKMFNLSQSQIGRIKRGESW